jgi:hypothetical protein
LAERLSTRHTTRVIGDARVARSHETRNPEGSWHQLLRPQESSR